MIFLVNCVIFRFYACFFRMTKLGMMDEYQSTSAIPIEISAAEGDFPFLKADHPAYKRRMKHSEKTKQKEW